MAYWGDTAISWADMVSQVLYFSKLDLDHQFHEDLIHLVWDSVNRNYCGLSMPLEEFRAQILNYHSEYVAEVTYIKPREIPKYTENIDISSFGFSEKIAKVIMHISAKALFTNTYSPNCERIRKEIVDGLYDILTKHFGPIDKEKYWALVTETIKTIQQAFIREYGPKELPEDEKRFDANYRSVEDLFDINREHPKK